MSEISRLVLVFLFRQDCGFEYYPLLPHRSSVDDRFLESAASSPNVMPSCSKIERSGTMQGCTAHSFELNQASYEHVRRTLVQLLKDSAIEHPAAWEKALMPMLLRCTNDVNPDVPRGDDMDIRHYIKLKKVPGGRPSDTSYVSGVMFSKQIALKSMADCQAWKQVLYLIGGVSKWVWCVVGFVRFLFITGTMVYLLCTYTYTNVRAYRSTTM